MEEQIVALIVNNKCGICSMKLTKYWLKQLIPTFLM